MKKQKGITLIALVITIIVLLILAGVSISMVIGNNGILNQASTAKTKTAEAEEAQQKALEDLKTEMDNWLLGGTTGVSFISQIDESNIGDYVNYPVDLGIATAGNVLSDSKVPTTDWRIFYEDGTNVFLIASDYLPTSKFPSGVFTENDGMYTGWWESSNQDSTKIITSGTITTNNSFLFTKLSNVKSTNLNYQAVTTLLDTSKWSKFAKMGYVENVETAVIGSPTLEMWIASWNKRYKGETLSCSADEIGYSIVVDGNPIKDLGLSSKEGANNTLYYPHREEWNGCHSYFLASPSQYQDIMIVTAHKNGGIAYTNYRNCDWYYRKTGVRPVVMLESSISATKVGDVWYLGE